MVVVGLVAMDVDHQAMLVGECDREPDGLHAVLAGELVVRDAAHDVSTERDRLAHQLAAAIETEYALLGEGNQLNVDQSAYLLAQVDQGAQRSKLRVADIHVAANMLDAAGELPAQDLPYAGLDVGV